MEDVPGKPGWIAQGGAKKGDPWLSFPVSFGARPKLFLVYLKSYGGSMGLAQFGWASDAGGQRAGFTLDGNWSTDASINCFAYFDTEKGHAQQQDIKPGKG